MLHSSVALRRMWLAFLFIYVVGLTSLPAGTTKAADLCADLKALVTQARSNFANWSAIASSTDVPLMLSGTKDCSISQSLSGLRSYHCTWPFPYRTETAHGTFDAFNQSIQKCFGEHASSSKDQQVNHPDFYDLRRYRIDDVEISVSMKDKIALQKTYLFIRVRRRSLD